MKYLGTITDSKDLTTKEYVDGQVSGVSTSLTNHIGDNNNPHKVTKSQVGLGNVEDKSSETIRGEITKGNVTTALGYTPPETDTTYTTGTSTYSGTTKLYSASGSATDGTMTQNAITTALNSYVPNTRTVNSKALSSNISLTATDVGAATTGLYSGTLGTSWAASGDYFTQAVSVSGILATDTPILDLICSTSNYEAEQEAWGKVFKAVCSANTITFYASEATETAVTVQVKVVR